MVSPEEIIDLHMERDSTCRSLGEKNNLSTRFTCPTLTYSLALFKVRIS
jgi:hypothetical protein